MKTTPLPQSPSCAVSQSPTSRHGGAVGGGGVDVDVAVLQVGPERGPGASGAQRGEGVAFPVGLLAPVPGEGGVGVAGEVGEQAAGIVGQADVAAADAESCTDAAAALRPDDDGSSPVVCQYTDVAQPHAVGEAGAHGLDRRFLAREAHRKETHGIPGALVQRHFLDHENAPREMIAETIIDALDAAQLDDVRTDAENHA